MASIFLGKTPARRGPGVYLPPVGKAVPLSFASRNEKGVERGGLEAVFDPDEARDETGKWTGTFNPSNNDITAFDPDEARDERGRWTASQMRSVLEKYGYAGNAAGNAYTRDEEPNHYAAIVGQNGNVMHSGVGFPKMFSQPGDLESRLHSIHGDPPVADAEEHTIKGIDKMAATFGFEANYQASGRTTHPWGYRVDRDATGAWKLIDFKSPAEKTLAAGTGTKELEQALNKLQPEMAVLHKYASNIRVGSLSGPPTLDRLAKTLKQLPELANYLDRHKLSELALVDRLAFGINGDYRTGDRLRLSMNPNEGEDSSGQQFVPGQSWSISSTAPKYGEQDKIDYTFVHEIGHHVQETSPSLDGKVKEMFDKYQGKSLTKYGAVSPSEWFAEHFAALNLYPKQFERAQPQVFHEFKSALMEAGYSA